MELKGSATERGIDGSAWETWRAAGAQFARDCLEKKVSVVPLGEESFRYAASRGTAHPEVVRRAFVGGYRSVVGGW